MFRRCRNLLLNRSKEFGNLCLWFGSLRSLFPSISMFFHCRSFINIDRNWLFIRFNGYMRLIGSACFHFRPAGNRPAPEMFCPNFPVLQNLQKLYTLYVRTFGNALYSVPSSYYLVIQYLVILFLVRLHEINKSNEFASDCDTFS